MKKIIGTLVTLEHATKEAIDTLYYWKYEDPTQEAKKWNAPYIREELVSKQTYQNQWNEEISAGVPAALVIKSEQEVIGYVGAYWVDWHTQWLETGIVIYDPSFWGGGYGTEAYQLWIDFLFSTTELHRLGMSTWSGNKRMMKAAQKTGMVEEARIRKARVVDGVYFDAIKMGILREEWEGKTTY
ncbi:RimJ/RimL family protein N-acetyltransferase [Salsuginibacillus halophilus]|uniref:RimJ/RimL family protein N-acetyltransferase n=1 Tax=Salsuginibacillus halophilus TaxID=517424 RepID=A0A2P8HX06_9BACI|nr:GNAT family protein [Salsuginibacillus halophilus]PSL50742.1 RimJ/RimL family protein N-acetyltransferase [Salsuginibacillus halophilus]